MPKAILVALWEGTATAKDGKPYNNTYSWHMTLNQGHREVAFFDTIDLADLWTRILLIRQQVTFNKNRKQIK